MIKISDVINYLTKVRNDYGDVEVILDKDGWLEDDFPRGVSPERIVAERGTFQIYSESPDHAFLIINN